MLKRVCRWKTIGDPDAPPPTSEPGITVLFKEIRTTVSQEAQIVKAVFPNPSGVMQVFLQRVFAQVVSPLMLHPRVRLTSVDRTISRNPHLPSTDNLHPGSTPYTASLPFYLLLTHRRPERIRRLPQFSYRRAIEGWRYGKRTSRGDARPRYGGDVRSLA